MTWQNARKQEWVFLLFSLESDDRLSLNFHRFVILYMSCDTQSVGLGQYCLPKVCNNFKNYFATTVIPVRRTKFKVFVFSDKKKSWGYCCNLNKKYFPLSIAYKKK